MGQSIQLLVLTFILILKFSQAQVAREIFANLTCESENSSDVCEIRYLAILNYPQSARRMDNWKLHEIRQTHAPVKNTKPPPGATTPAFTLPPTQATTLDYLRMPGFAQKSSLQFNHCNTTFLPVKLGEVFPHVTSIFVWNSGLEELKPEYFFNMENRLIELSFQDNLISSLAINPFFGTTLVVRLNLAFNRIRVVAPELLTTMTKLEIFLINSNLIEVLPIRFFDRSTALKFANFNNNRIKSIEYDFNNVPGTIKLLGMGNTCANFFLGKGMSKEQLTALVRKDCTPQAG